MVAVADSRYQSRILDNQEFDWLRNDIEEYNEHADEKRVSLLESVGREKMKEREARKAERKAQREAGPLLEEDSLLVDADPELGDFSDDEDENAESDEDKDEGPDLLLREAARIVADMAELGSDIDLLKQQFAQLDKDATDQPELP